MESLSGVLPVIATPFTSQGDIDYPALTVEVEWIFDQGAHGVTMGMVSETLRLSSHERDGLATALVKAAQGHGSVVTSVGAESSHTAERHARHAEFCGATAVMAIPPISTAADDDELMAYYAGLVNAISIPVVIQDASGYLGRPLTVEVQARLHREFGDRVAFKPEAQPIGPKLSALRDATQGGARIFEGTGGLALVDSFKRGITGTMPGPDICWALVALWNALKAGRVNVVNALHGPICALVSIQTSLDAFVTVEKHLLHRQGVLPNLNTRGPGALTLDPETVTEVDRLFDLVRDIVASSSSQ